MTVTPEVGVRDAPAHKTHRCWTVNKQHETAEYFQDAEQKKVTDSNRWIAE